MCLTGTLTIAAEPPPPPAIVESWTCSYKAGQGLDDLLGARDYLQRQADKSDVQLGPSFLWSLVKGDVPIDTVWLSPYENLSAWAAAEDASAANEDMAGVGARFGEVSDCTARLGTIRQVYAREGAADDDDQAMISTLGCSLRQGVNDAALNDLYNHVNGVFGGLGDAAPNASYAISPITGGPTTPDLVLFSVFNNATGYANFINALFGNQANSSLGRHLNAVADCNPALWSGMQVTGPTDG